ncbi:putative membrane protein [Andreprevotia lacus DSM 23236]|jgi:putative membrane protein|uniref:Putative membrane protein n=1 Tax=Andreprevotia lacus DSM 23236 TaxID=1121001 RepID=A0A1W1Y0E3_9NEIS|nr:bestrophin family protein [Andreprevotia lacus]SMC29597.1 putative membrane protein [Andreprevotia lacus DSM 23236]
MIVRPSENWFRLLFVWNGSVLQSIIPQLSVIGIVSTIAVLTHGRVFGEKIPLNIAPFTLFGLALAIFLAFRNNVSYERFREARQLWGKLLVSARAIMSQTLCYLPGHTDKRHVARMLIAFVYSLKHQLRGSDAQADLQRLLGDDYTRTLQQKCFQPITILDDLRRYLVGAAQGQQTSATTLWMLDAQLNELGSAVGGCERIASTPIPVAYNVLLHRTVYAYCVLLPFGLVDSAGFFTPLLCVFFAYTLIALEAIASEVAEPFSTAANALALDAMSRNIERSVLELCGDALPPEVTPIRHYHLT